jgi:hypothetical protein
MKSASYSTNTAAPAAGVLAALAFALAGPTAAQPGGAGAAPPPARSAAPIDVTGQWVSVVTEDWRFRMVTPQRGDYPGIALTPAGRAAAEAWDAERDEAAGEACKAYGAGGIMRMPGRLRIAWESDSTLVIEADAGSQTRTLHFGQAPTQQEPTWQGVTTAEWIMHGGGRGQPPVNGTISAVTTGGRPGYLRKNGVPYGEQAVITEYFDLLRQPDGSEWLVVKTIVEDPVHLGAPYITSSNFRKESSEEGWSPTECTAY